MSVVLGFFSTVLGSSPGVFLGITVVFMGGCAFMTGQALASTWRPWWQALIYALLLGAGDRFLTYALFQGRLTSPGGYIVDTILLAAITLFGFRLTRARQMVRQYPWLYDRSGLLGWKDRGARVP